MITAAYVCKAMGWDHGSIVYWRGSPIDWSQPLSPEQEVGIERAITRKKEMEEEQAKMNAFMSLAALKLERK